MSFRTETARLLFLSGVGGLVLWSWGSLGGYFDLLGELLERPPIERTYLALDPSQNFLTLAGRPDRRERMSQKRKTVGSNLIAKRGQWLVRVAETIPADARIYLNTPNSQLYFQGSFLWYPARVEVSLKPALIKDDATLRDAQRRVEPARFPVLLAQGYTHVIVIGSDGPRLIALARTKERR